MEADKRVDTVFPDGSPPPREGSHNSYYSFTDEQLWPHIVRASGSALVGIRAPRTERGVFRGRVLTNARDIRHAVDRISSINGATPAYLEDSENRQAYPVVRVTFNHFRSLIAVRGLPEVDYVEPQISFYIGCGQPDYLGDAADEDFAPNPGAQPTNRVPWNFRHMRIQDAWRLFNQNGQIVAPGRGIKIGVVDTGTFPDQPRLNEGFDSPAGSRSAPQHLYVDTEEVLCSHGTRIAGLAAAPADGNTTDYVGVAWGSDLVTVRVNDGVVVVGGTAIYGVGKGLDMVVDAGARVVTMAFGLPIESQYLKDKIIGIYENHPDVIMVVAAGTSVFDVTFPGTMEREVVTSTIVDYKPTPPYQYVRRAEAYFPDQVAYGPAVDIVAVHSSSDIPTTGDGSHPITTLGGSSCSTSLIAGILAIAWSRLPHLSRSELLDRLTNSAHYGQIEDVGDVSNGKTAKVGYGIPDAYLVAGGARRVWIDAPIWSSETAYTLVARIDGDVALFDFRWDSGESSQSISATATGTTARTHTVWATNRYDQAVIQASIEVRASRTATLRIFDVFAEGLGDNAVIDWATDKPANGRVAFGTSGNLSSGVNLPPELVTGHSVVLRGLRHRATYAFRIECRAEDGSASEARGSFYNPDIAQ